MGKYDWPDDLPLPGTRSDDHETSLEAAATVVKVRGTIARRVLEHAASDDVSGLGFIDDDLKALYPDAPESSYRKRRTELAAAGYLSSAGDQRKNRKGQRELVWRITPKGREAL